MRREEVKAKVITSSWLGVMGPKFLTGGGKRKKAKVIRKSGLGLVSPRFLTRGGKRKMQ